jgi:hypothetical protein
MISGAGDHPASAELDRGDGAVRTVHRVRGNITEAAVVGHRNLAARHL